MSLSEICASGIASLLVPYPYAAADHQRKNAKYMVEQGASLYLEDRDVNAKSLLENLTLLITDREKLAKLQGAAMKLSKFDGVEKIVQQLKEIAK